MPINEIVAFVGLLAILGIIGYAAKEIGKHKFIS